MKSGDYGLLSAFLKRSCYESFSDPLRSCVFGRVADNAAIDDGGQSVTISELP